MTLPAAQVLRRTPLFTTLAEDDLRRVAAVAVPRKYGKKEAVFREGDRADGFFVVASGKVKVFKLSEEGKEQVLHVVEPGQSFAEAAIFEGGSYPAHAEALADSELHLLPKAAFIELLERNPRLALRMLVSLSRWLRRMADLVENLSLRDVEARLVLFLSEELKNRGIPARDGATLDLPLEPDPASFHKAEGADLYDQVAYRTRLALSDGGVYDNLGLEAIWNRYQTVLVSDAGAPLDIAADPERAWHSQVLRVLDITTNQDRALRKRALIADLVTRARTGAYWGIMSEMAGYRLDDALPVPLGATRYLASLRTRLDAFSEGEQCRLINGGYALCDAALRKYVVTGQPIPPPKCPYPACALDQPIPPPSGRPIAPDPPSGR